MEEAIARLAQQLCLHEELANDADRQLRLFQLCLSDEGILLLLRVAQQAGNSEMNLLLLQEADDAPQIALWVDSVLLGARIADVHLFIKKLLVEASHQEQDLQPKNTEGVPSAAADASLLQIEVVSLSLCYARATP